MVGNHPEVLMNFDRLVSQTQPVHLQLAAGSPRSLQHYSLEYKEPVIVAYAFPFKTSVTELNLPFNFLTPFCTQNGAAKSVD
jgi:hypothetical protein